MARQGVSRLEAFVRLAAGVGLVVREAVSAAPVINRLRAGDLRGSAVATVKGLVEAATELTGLTRGRLHPYQGLDPSVSHEDGKYVRVANESAAEGHKEREGQREVATETSPGIVSSQLNERASRNTRGKSHQQQVNEFGRHEGPLGVTIDPATSKPDSMQRDERACSADVGFAARLEEEQQASTGGTSSASARQDAELDAELRKVGAGGLPGAGEPVMRRRRPRERHVPSTSLGRVLGFAGLGAGLAWGTLQESAKRLWEGQGKSAGAAGLSPFITEQNAERLALALCRMRGAALKLGQMLSIQDESIVPPQVLAALESVRQGADVMPRRQLNKVLVHELGSDWRDRLDSFEDEPIASASIGQVHRAVLKDGRTVAMKVQYPGVADSINSDIENVKRLLDYTNLIPEGLYLDQAMKVAKDELARECNYELEASNQKRFKQLLSGQKGLHVPEVIDEFSSKRVLTSELVPGVSIDKVAKLSQETRNSVALRLLRLTLTELFEFRFMQTDPNWGNFLYDESTDTINLIDFGAARDYPKHFVDNYLQMVRACADKDRSKVIEMSVKLGFLTGQESKLMLDAHVEAAFVVGLPFANFGGYDFRSTDLTKRVSALGATMLRHRLTPPPDEAYSLHRKLSGAFLACIKLRSVVPCREMFLQVYDSYKFSSVDDEEQEAATEALASG